VGGALDFSTSLTRAPWDALTALEYRLTGDTAAARGKRGRSAPLRRATPPASPAATAATRDDRTVPGRAGRPRARGADAVGRDRAARPADARADGARPATRRRPGDAGGDQRRTATGQAALVDDLGTVTFTELTARVERIAVGLRDDFGVGPDRSLAIMCRNHRGFVEALLAGSRLGAELLLLNTEFPPAQLARVLERDRPGAVVHDAEYEAAFDDAGFEQRRIVAWHDGDVARPTLDALAAPRAHRAAAVHAATEPDRDPDVGHDRGSQGRAAGARPRRVDRPDDDVAVRTCRCGPASRCWSRRRSSTATGSRTCRSG